jgi:hypothetical protein
MKTGRTHQGRESHPGDQLTAATPSPGPGAWGRKSSQPGGSCRHLVTVIPACHPPRHQRLVLAGTATAAALASSRLIGTQVTAVTWPIPPLPDGS